MQRPAGHNWWEEEEAEKRERGKTTALHTPPPNSLLHHPSSSTADFNHPLVINILCCCCSSSITQLFEAGHCCVHRPSTLQPVAVVHNDAFCYVAWINVWMWWFLPIIVCSASPLDVLLGCTWGDLLRFVPCVIVWHRKKIFFSLQFWNF